MTSPSFVCEQEQAIAPLTLPLNSKPESKALAAGYGGPPRPVVFGSNARRSLLRAGGALEKHGVQLESQLFLTGTLPGSSRESFEALQCYSSYAVNLLKAKLSKLGCRHTYSLYCWELQERGALHIHYCLVVEDEETKRKVLEGWKKMWEQVIDAIGRKAGVDMWDRGNGRTWKDNKSVLQAPAQQVYKSVGSYLSKYLSKSSNPTYSKVFGDHRYLGPVRWWGVSRPLLELIRAYSDRVEVEGVHPQRLRKIREEIKSVLQGMDARIEQYTDRAKSAEVLVSYSPENATYVFMQLARILTPGWMVRIHDFQDGKRGYPSVFEPGAAELPGIPTKGAIEYIDDGNGDGLSGACESIYAKQLVFDFGVAGLD